MRRQRIFHRWEYDDEKEVYICQRCGESSKTPYKGECSKTRITELQREVEELRLKILQEIKED